MKVVPTQRRSRNRLGEANRISKGDQDNLSNHPSIVLRTDRIKLARILGNLIGNAIKFTERGEVLLSVAVDSCSEGNVILRFSIADTGIGIAPEIQAHIFERFGRGKPEITTIDRGSGLGLPIVKGLVDMHGGRIALESMPGVGTRVTVIFPASSTLKQSARRVA